MFDTEKENVAAEVTSHFEIIERNDFYATIVTGRGPVGLEPMFLSLEKQFGIKAEAVIFGHEVTIFLEKRPNQPPKS